MKRLLSILSFSLIILHSAFAQTYTNPVYDWDFPDPSIQRAQDGIFYCYATGCQTVKSADLVHWTSVSDVFSRPTWNDSTYVKDGKQKTDYYSLWASDVNFVGTRYIMYYASALWENGSRTGIGVATGLTPYKFSDVGKLFRSTEIKVENSIDPVYIEEWDKKYLAWGSFNGIYITELSDDGLKVKDMSQIKKIAGTSFEGAMIHKHGKYYYLFASIGSCCEGLNSSYQTVVGRATKLTGPYISKSGQLMTNNGYTLLITKNAKWVGPGHNSEIVTDDKGQDWILYHGYDAADPDKGRVLLLDRLLWDEQGWPYIQGGSPSRTEQEAPFFYNGDGSRMDYKLRNADFMKSEFSGWTVEKDASVTLTSGLGTPFAPVAHAAGGGFSIEQSCSGLPDGYYEVQLQGFSTLGNAQLRVGSVLTPMLDARSLSDPIPASADDFSQAVFNGSYEQSAYGLVVGGRLTLGLMGNLAADEEAWFANVCLVRRHQNEAVGQILQSWYIQRAQQVLESTHVDDYYKGKIQTYITDLEQATTSAERYNALVTLHKMLDRLSALDPLYDGIEEIHNGQFTMDNAQCYDLSGRPVVNRKSSIPSGIYVREGKKIMQGVK